MRNNMKKSVTFALIFLLFISTLSFGGNSAYAKSIKSPSKFTTSSRAYSTTLKWNKVTGGSGYVVYHRTANSKYKKIKTTTATSYIHYNLKANAKHYYRVKSYEKKKGKTTYSKYSKTVIIKTKVATKPKVYTFMTDKKDDSAAIVVLAIKNKSNKSIYIQKYGDLIDNDYADYDRSLTLVKFTSNDRLYYPKSITIKPNSETYIAYVVNGSPTWYDENTMIRFYFYYEGQLWHQYATIDDNYNYIEVDFKP